MDQGSKPFALIYRIYYKLLGTQFNPGAMINREPAGKTMLIQCSTPDARVPISKMIQCKMSSFLLNGCWNKKPLLLKVPLISGVIILIPFIGGIICLHR